jgi:Sulfotransferase family
VSTQSPPAATASGIASSGRNLALDEPVIVLTAARSGSTMLRLLLDAHPDLACPPETNVAKVATQLAGVWGLLAGNEDGPPDTAMAAVRHVVDTMFASYLAARGKLRWCDKSLGTAEVAGNLARLYPRTRFICLYRHAMDVIASALEACPWGISGYGFEPYASNSPGNSVAAIAHYWADHMTAILEFERAHPEACLRVRYEDLAARPRDAAARIFGFLGVAHDPDIAARFLAEAGSHPPGPADYKIWSTSQVSTDSIGRGTRIPLGAIPPPLLEVVNGLLGELGYQQVAEDWNHGAADYRPGAGPPAAGAPPAAEVAGTLALVAGRISDALGRGRTGPPGGPADPAAWRPGRVAVSVVDRDLGSRQTVIADFGAATVAEADEIPGDCAWELTGDPGTWRAVLAGQANLGVAVRRGELRYVREAADAPPRDVRLQVTARMLGLTR